mgnify:FL=1
MEIIIASDLAPTKTNSHIFQTDEILKKIDKNFKNEWFNADFRILNLETVLGKKENLKPINKAGPNIIADSKCIYGIKKLNPDLVLLSNNHILDYGEKGLNNTLKILNENNINYTGIINSINEEYNGYIFEIENIKFGIYNVCENEFSVATSKSKGANPLIESKVYLEIQKLKKTVDYLIVVFHGGKEFYRYPTPNLQRICRSFVDFGADAVIVQHTHCIGSEEIYKDKTILYGQGNFIFYNDEYVNDTSVLDTALLVKIIIEDKKLKIKYIPIERCEGLVKISDNKSIIKEFENRSNDIKKENFINKNYEEFAKEMLNTYLKVFDRKKIINRLINKFFIHHFYEKIYKNDDYIGISNIIECEAHRELLITGLKAKIKELEKKNEI